MTTQITLQLDLTTDTTGNAKQVARMIGVSAWRISEGCLIIEDPLLDYRVTDNETYSYKTDRIPNGAVVILVQDELKTPEQKIEQEIQAKGLNAPRLTPEIIDSKIALEMYFGGSGLIDAQTHGHHLGLMRFQHHEGEDLHKPIETLTFCILVLKNGFTVTGESACASPENFDAEIGRKIAYNNAREKIWLLEGYLLKQHLYSYSIAPNESDIKAEEPSESPVHSASVVPFQPNHKHDLAYLLLEILKSNPASGLRTKIESKLSKLLDELV